jgi:hypothetical protein
MLYFLVSFILQAAMKKPMYVDNLNWTCDENQSFFYSEENSRNIISKHLKDTTCETWAKTYKPGEKIKHCEPLTNNYYCNVKGDDVSELKAMGAVEYSAWKNCWFFVTVVMIVSILSFCLSFGMHKAKLCGVQPYKGRKDQ